MVKANGKLEKEVLSLEVCFTLTASKVINLI
jgi:hypothetical protein